MHFMLQKEVVERMVAAPGESEFSRLSVMLQYRFWLEWLLDVPPGSFDPPPKVDSAVVRMIPRDPAELLAHDEALLSRVVAAAFAQRRKMLRNNLKGILDDAAFGELGIAPTLRAEDVPVADYVRIANWLTEKK
jgi:16S rRNA (adenine1518-N6/adenine1519-N6)-dimethyltransferase